MKRLVVAILGGAVVAGAILVTLALALQSSKDEVPEPAPIRYDPPSFDSDLETTSRRPMPVEECGSTAAAIRSLIDQNKNCRTDNDCELVHVGSPFGCNESVSANSLKLVTENLSEYASECTSSTYVCAPASYEFRAICRRGLCDVGDGSIDEVRSETGDHIDLENQAKCSM